VTKKDAGGDQSSLLPTLQQLVAEMNRLGGADYDFGAEEWDVLPTELLDQLIESGDEVGPERHSKTKDWGADRG
jgi:hypothetical protein